MKIGEWVKEKTSTRIGTITNKSKKDNQVCVRWLPFKRTSISWLKDYDVEVLAIELNYDSLMHLAVELGNKEMFDYYGRMKGEK